jgi:hypothetical protein
MSFDEEVRNIYIDIAEKHGIVIEKVPLEGKKHLEKNDFILARQQEEIAKQQGEIANQQARLEEITMKISDVEELIDEVSTAAYEKACEVVADTVHVETLKEDVGLVEQYRDKMVEVADNPAKKTFAKKILDSLINVFADRGRQLAENVRKALLSPEVKKKNEEQIKTVARTSLRDRLKKAQAEVRQNEANRRVMPSKRREQSL